MKKILTITGIMLFILMAKKKTSNATQQGNHPNVQAALKAIRYAEHSDADVDANRDWYIQYGGGTFSDLSDHPALLGWQGKLLPPSFCLAIRNKDGEQIFPDGVCRSYAAGAFQITKGTWNRLRSTYGEELLPDFSPASQTAAALLLIEEQGALNDFIAGKFADGIYKINDIWASLPGYNEGQPEVSIAYLSDKYTSAGGTLA